MLNFEQEVELGKRLAVWDVDVSELKAIDLTEMGFSGAFVFEQSRGGKAIIIGIDGKFLGVASSLNIDDVINDIKNNNLWEKAMQPTKSVVCPFCGNQKVFDLTKVPANVKFDYICEKCGSRHYIKL